ncbi:response regulator [Prosthecomicrobium sp. N25]|uniref:response regulator n=1 Tax=Prosthecomicrobium sp. N25 TaxID=3129254 RepID=UPI0030775E20
MKPRVLIVEDDPLIALDLEIIIADKVPAEVIVAASVADARRHVAEPITFALLDIDVLDGKTFEIAEALAARNTPFVFVSGSKPQEVPEPLRRAGFIPKPYRPEKIEETVEAALATR